MKKLSIIIPAYNASKFIVNTIESIKQLKGLTNDLEVVIVNDGSTDNTVEIVKDYNLSNNLNIKILSQDNKGVSSARNNGIENASNEYLLFLDSDDLLHEDFLIEFNKFSNDADIFIYLYEEINVRGTKTTNNEVQYSYKNGINKGIKFLDDVLKNKVPIWTASMVYKRSYISKNKILYTEGYSYGEDKEFQYKALSCNGQVLYSHKVLSYYVTRKGSLVNSINYKFFDSIYLKIDTIKYLDQRIDSAKQHDSIRGSLSKQVAATFRSYYFKLYGANKKLPFYSKRVLNKEIKKRYPNLFNIIKPYIYLKGTKSLRTLIADIACYYTPFIYYHLHKGRK